MTLIKIGSSLENHLVEGLVASETVDAFSVSDNNNITGKFIKQLMGDSFNSYQSLETTTQVFSNSGAIDAIYADETTMNAVVSSSKAMETLASSQTAVDKLILNQVAMNRVIASENAMNEIIKSPIALYSICLDGGSNDAINWLEYLAGNVNGGYTTAWEDDTKWQTLFDTLNNATSLFNKTYFSDTGSDVGFNRKGDQIVLIESAFSTSSSAYDMSITPAYTGCYNHNLTYNWSTGKHIMWGGHESYHDYNNTSLCVVKHYVFEPII